LTYDFQNRPVVKIHVGAKFHPSHELSLPQTGLKMLDVKLQDVHGTNGQSIAGHEIEKNSGEHI